MKTGMKNLRDDEIQTETINNKTNSQCHPNELAHHERYKNNKVQPYH